ncbi:putative lipopolysaccharide biosynthesis O-acetyl transferase WbbJ [Rosistilla ulvae]|uniref:Putative lipopolysaccharide biosynthesis O-acetyl transferase WbbJ n=1 Tax=Rosistilla ulvae TaxID=1930277 RepID=A0A517M0F4_9BACT|nr:acyltransferase [Rosistilla ulvae]QDS88353.1 putative lipopolysaccharide biosynthesis O-acetyl transferase WbbJ [Rosistilla ulvae]
MKPAIKATCRGLATLIILPLGLTHGILGRIAGRDGSLETHTQLLAWLPGTLGSYLRVAFCRMALEHCAPTATIGFGTLLSKVGARIEANVYIGPRCMLGLVTLQQDVLLGPAVQIPSGPQTHGTTRLDIPIRLQPGKQARVTVGRDSWIGAGAIVLADIGEQTIVGAGSIVTKPTASRVIVVGNAANPLSGR